MFSDSISKLQNFERILVEPRTDISNYYRVALQQ